jgi:predicted nucleotidyltransferase
MVKTKYTAVEIKKIIKSLAETLVANRIAVDKIILYGSYAKGTPRLHSDIDIAVIWTCPPKIVPFPIRV